MANFGSEQYRRWTLEQKKKFVTEYENIKLREAKDGVRGGIGRFLIKHNITAAHIRQWAKHISKAVRGAVSQPTTRR